MRYTEAGQERHAERMRTDREYRERVFELLQKVQCET